MWLFGAGHGWGYVRAACLLWEGYLDFVPKGW